MVLPVEVSERGTLVLGMTVEAGKSNLRGLEALNLLREVRMSRFSLQIVQTV